MTMSAGTAPFATPVDAITAATLGAIMESASLRSVGPLFVPPDAVAS